MKSIKYVEEDGQRERRNKEGSGGGNEEGREVCGADVEVVTVRECEDGRKKREDASPLSRVAACALGFDLSRKDTSSSTFECRANEAQMRRTQK